MDIDDNIEGGVGFKSRDERHRSIQEDSITRNDEHYTHETHSSNTRYSKGKGKTIEQDTSRTSRRHSRRSASCDRDCDHDHEYDSRHRLDSRRSGRRSQERALEGEDTPRRENHRRAWSRSRGEDDTDSKHARRRHGRSRGDDTIGAPEKQLDHKRSRNHSRGERNGQTCESLSGVSRAREVDGAAGWSRATRGGDNERSSTLADENSARRRSRTPKHRRSSTRRDGPHVHEDRGLFSDTYSRASKVKHVEDGKKEGPCHGLVHVSWLKLEMREDAHRLHLRPVQYLIILTSGFLPRRLTPI
ncbi:hypothetical protein BDQ17DRAFT_551526 [Cyathus striatus]|nr:hypothetical protein BDQ17DRAFT_551526 [Cyathus striatus]